MDNKKMVKVALAFALAGAVFAPSFKEAHANYVYDSSASVETNYENLRVELKRLVDDSDNFITLPEYQKSSFVDKSNYADALGAAQYASIKKGDTPTELDLKKLTDVYEKFVRAINAFKGGESIGLVDNKELNKLIGEYNQLMKLDEYKNAPDALKNKYTNAVKNAKAKSKSLGKNMTALDYGNMVDSIKAAKNAIENAAKANKDKKPVAKKANDKKESTEGQIVKLKEAIKKNSEAKKAAELLIKLAPETVQPIKGKLDKLIKDSQTKLDAANKVLDRLQTK